MYHRHKYNAVRTEVNNIRFASKKEANYYDELLLKKEAGIVLFFLMQVPFHLPGNVTYRVDFQEFHTDGTIHFVDVKGVRTKEFIRNKKMVEALFPVEIEER